MFLCARMTLTNLPNKAAINVAGFLLARDLIKLSEGKTKHTSELKLWMLGLSLFKGK